MIDIKRILCPLDYSEFSRHALDHTIAIAQWYGASATALFVLPQVAAAALERLRGSITRDARIYSQVHGNHHRRQGVP